jgi:hypothetical protein
LQEEKMINVRNQKLTRLHKYNKAQLQTMESIAVLVVFFFLIAIGLRFYGQTQVKEYERIRSEFESLDSIKVTNKLMSMPELICTRMNIQDVACFDYYKAKAWESLGDRMIGQYLNFFGESTLTIEFLYPASNEPSITLYNNTPVLNQNLRYNKRTSYVPITVYKERIHYFAILKIEQYNRQN